MKDKNINTTAPLTETDKLLRGKFYETIAAQSGLMDKLIERLLTLELAIPGLYAMALKLMRGDKATVAASATLIAAFACWLLALALTLLALTPRKWKVDPFILKQDPMKFSEGLGIEDFFTQSALHKRRLVIASSIFFFAGVICAVFTTVSSQ